MKRINKVFIGAVALISTLSPIIYLASCTAPTTIITFSVSFGTMSNSKQGSFDLSWMPADTSLTLSNFKFKYINDSKEATVRVSQNSSKRPLTINLEFHEDISEDINDGKLSFHWKDEKNKTEFNKEIEGVKITKYEPAPPPPVTHTINNPITEFKTYCPTSKKSVDEWTNSPVMTLDDGVDANWSFTPINEGWVSLLNPEEEPNFIFIKDSSVANGMKLKFNAISEMDERKTASLNSMFSAAGSNTISQDVNIEAVSKNDESVKANFTFSAKLSIKFMYKIKDVPDDSDISPIQIDGNGNMIYDYTLGTSAGDSLMYLEDDKGDIIDIKDQTWEKVVACDYSNFDPTKAQIIVRNDNKFMLFLKKGAVWSASESNKVTFTIKLSNPEFGTFTATCQVGFDEY